MVLPRDQAVRRFLIISFNHGPALPLLVDYKTHSEMITILIFRKGLLAQAEKEIGERRQKKRQLIEPPVPLESALPPLERM